MQKLKDTKIKETLMNLPSENQEQRYEEILKLAKRITMLIRELEVTSLDVALYAKALSKGNFPISYVLEIDKTLEHADTELKRIHKGWFEVFKEAFNVPSNT